MRLTKRGWIVLNVTVPLAIIAVMSLVGAIEGVS